MNFPRLGRMNRRVFLADVGLGFTGLALGAMMQRESRAEGVVWSPPDGLPHTAPKAKSVIWLFMNGGVSHMESFDPKPMLAKYAGQPLPGEYLRTERKTGAAFPSPFAFQKYGQSGLEVYMLERHQGSGQTFAGAFVFPGGANDPDAPPPFDFASASPLCVCPVCAKKKKDGKIFQTPERYICNVAAKDSKACNGSLPRVLCKKEISSENAIKFFTEGKSDLIEGMISKRGRPFSAFLQCKAGEKRLLGWEFPPREAKPKAAKAAPKPRGRFAKKAVAGE
mgnify:CR=1 FL=1